MDKEKLSPLVSKLGRALLAGTCLTGVSAIAGTVNEPPDFGNAPNGTLLPVGTNHVTGTVNAFLGEGQPADIDWFEFTGLGAGTFQLSGFGESICWAVQTDGASPINSGCAGGSISNFASGAIPGDGKIVMKIQDNNEGTSAYSVDLFTEISTQPTVPEPSTLVPVGLALAGALAWRRKRT